MPTLNARSEKLSKLRIDAETRLKEGSAPPTVGWSVGVNALSMLHKLASAPASAIDALKLLHELQVHQVELDLQHEQMEATQRELTEDLAHYQGLYEFAPIPYLNVSPQGDILECNRAAAILFGVEQVQLRDRSIDSLVASASRPVFRQLLNRLSADDPTGNCEIQLAASKGKRKIQAVASATSGGRSFLVVLLDVAQHG